MKNSKAVLKYKQTHDEFGNYIPLQYKTKKKSRNIKKVCSKIDLSQYPDFIKLYVIRNIENMNKWEKATQKILEKYGINYQVQVPVLLNRKYYIMDFLIKYADMQICLEIDGYWHYNNESKAKDSIRDRRMRKAGYTVIRITDKQIEKTPDLLIDKLEFLGIPIIEPAVS
jgi:very-short-patch-repair endonuclease